MTSIENYIHSLFGTDWEVFLSKEYKFEEKMILGVKKMIVKRRMSLERLKIQC